MKQRQATSPLNVNFLFKGNEPCAVIAGPLPPNGNTAQNAAMSWLGEKVGGVVRMKMSDQGRYADVGVDGVRAGSAVASH
jgi:hypothetical protein